MTDDVFDNLTSRIVDVIGVLMIGLQEFIKVESLYYRLTGDRVY